MSGVGDFGIDPKDIPTPELVNKIMADFGVNKETAGRIIDYCNTFAIGKMDKWVRNNKKTLKRKAEAIYQLTRSLKRGKGNKLLIDQIEKLILELCVE